MASVATPQHTAFEFTKHECPQGSDCTGHCSPVDDTPRDSEGYPLTARRKILWIDAHTVKDMQTGQRFTFKKDFKENKNTKKAAEAGADKEIKEQIKEGVKMRLVPVFPGQVT